MHPKPDTQDPLREALERIVAVAEADSPAGSTATRMKLIAREALAGEPPEVEWEYRRVDEPGPEYHQMRRRKAGEWQRVDDHSNLDLLADALSTPGQQEER